MNDIHETVEAEAFNSGRLYIIIDDETVPCRSRYICGFAGDSSVPPSETVRMVHLMSRGAHGEIRSYAIVGNERILRMRGARHSVMSWPELDAEVERRTGMTVLQYEREL